MTLQHSPTVSVVIAAYNEEDRIETAAKSVLEQDYQDLELIVVDDGSTDQTLKRLESIADSRLVILQTHRGGQYSALVAGIRHSKAKYIARLDADDRCLPGRISAQVAYLEAHPNCAWLGTGERRVDLQRDEVYDRRYPEKDTLLRRMAARCIPYCHSSIMFPRSIVETDGLIYGTQSPFMNDFEFFIDVARRHEVANLNDSYVERITSDGSFYQRSFSTRKQNWRLIRLNARAIRRLNLGWHHYVFLGGRIFYPWLPVRLKANVRRLLGLREREAG